MHFSSAEKAALYLALSDHESGSPRQWLFLELAAQETRGERSKRARWWVFLLGKLGPALLAPALLQRGLTGAALYHNAGLYRLQLMRQSLNDSILLSISLLALLAGFERLRASMQFALWLLTLAGAGWQIWRTGKPQSESPPHDLPGAEASLGLYGLLIAKGLAPDKALQLLEQLRTQPAEGLITLQQQLPEINPATASRHARLFKAGSWLLPLLPASWLLGLLPASWGWIICALLLITTSCLINRHWQPPALLALAGLCFYALARLVHWW